MGHTDFPAQTPNSFGPLILHASPATGLLHKLFLLSQAPSSPFFTTIHPSDPSLSC